jgi:hypothetical protein
MKIYSDIMKRLNFSIEKVKIISLRGQREIQQTQTMMEDNQIGNRRYNRGLALSNQFEIQRTNLKL